MPTDPDLWAVLSFYALTPSSVRQIEPVGAGGGWSGARLWRVTDVAGREFCLRQWPAEHPTVDRLRLIHQVLHAVVGSGISFVPAPRLGRTGESFVRGGNRLWELIPWLPGRADYRDRPSPVRLGAALVALAQFHQAAMTVRPPHVRPAPTLADRHAQFMALRSGGLDALGAAINHSVAAALDARAGALLQLAREVLPRIETRIASAQDIALPLQPAVRDIHHEHVLFTDDEVTGLVDFGALRIDTPLADVARMVGSLVGDDPAARQFALEAYAKLRPLSQSDRQLIDLLDESGLVLGGLNWLIWLYVERRDMGDIVPIVRRLDEILTRLQRRARH